MHARRWLRWARSSYLAPIAVVGIAIAPVAMPILPPATFARFYGSHTATANAAEAESGAGALPQVLADRLGWKRLIRTMEGVYAALPPSQRAQACVIASNYGEASALSFLAAPGSIPPVMSGHNNYFLWGPGGCSGKVLITVGFDSKDIRAARTAYRRVRLAATDSCTYCVAFERRLPIYVLSDPVCPTFDLRKVWPSLKHYD